MRRVLRGAVPLLAAALGFARPASAQFAVPADPADPAPAISVNADDEVSPLPRVVPHRSIVLEPMKEPADAEAPTTRPPEHRPRVIPAHAVVAPSGLPGGAPAGAFVSVPSSKPAPPAPSWPAAFLVGKDAEVTGVKQVSHSETTDDLTPPPWENGEAPAVADVKRRVESTYGRQVTGMAAEMQANGVVVVRVRIRSAAADPNHGKTVELPQAAGSGVRVLLEVER